MASPPESRDNRTGTALRRRSSSVSATDDERRTSNGRATSGMGSRQHSNGSVGSSGGGSRASGRERSASTSSNRRVTDLMDANPFSLSDRGGVGVGGRPVSERGMRRSVSDNVIGMTLMPSERGDRARTSHHRDRSSSSNTSNTSDERPRRTSSNTSSNNGDERRTMNRQSSLDRFQPRTSGSTNVKLSDYSQYGDRDRSGSSSGRARTGAGGRRGSIGGGLPDALDRASIANLPPLRGRDASTSSISGGGKTPPRGYETTSRM
jgi:hypothetical protein